MKKTVAKKRANKWYLVFDGKNHTITVNIGEYEALNVIAIELTAEQTANYLLLKQKTQA